MRPLGYDREHDLNTRKEFVKILLEILKFMLPK